MFSLTAQLQLRAPNNVNQVLRQVQNQLQGVNVPLTITGQAQVQRGLTRTNAAVNDLNRSSGRLTKSFAVLTRRFAAFSIATRAISLLTNKLSSAVDEAIEFEREINKISQVTGKTAGQLKSLTNDITNLSTTLGVSSNQLATVGRVLSQAGFKANDLSFALKALAKTSLAPTFDDITKTAEGAIAIFNQFGQGAAALEGQLGAINAVAGKFAVESSDLIGAVSRVGGVFASAGGNLNELIGLFTSVRSTTRESAESIATGLRTILTRIQRPATIAYLEQLGVSLTKLDGSFVGPFEAIKRMNAALGNIPAGDLRFVKIAEQLGGFRQIGKVIPLLQNFAVAEEARQTALRGGDSLTKDAATAQQSLAVQISKVKEEYLALIRGFADSSTFRVLVKSSLALASSLASVLSTLKPLLPLITAFATVKLGGGLIGALRPRLAGARGPIGLASGGVVPGSGSGDTVPAMLTPGEFVIKKSSVSKIGTSTLHSMNAQHFVDGGKVRDRVAEQRGTKAPSRDLASTKSSPGIAELVDRVDDIPDSNRYDQFGGAFLSPEGDVRDLRGKIPGNSIFEELKKNKTYKLFEKANADSEGGKKIRAMKKSLEEKFDFTIFGEALSKKKADDVEKTIYDGVLGAVQNGAGLLSSSSKINEAGADKTNVAANILRSANIDNVIGNLYEGILTNAGAPFDGDARGAANATFDFPDGLGNVASNFGTGKRLENITTDAKTRFTTDNLQSLKKKVKNSETNRLSQELENIFNSIKIEDVDSIFKETSKGGGDSRRKAAAAINARSAVGLMAGGPVERVGGTGIFDSDYISGGTKDKNAILDAVLGKKVVAAIWGPAGSGKSTLARSRYGGGLVGSLADIDNYDDFAVISGAGKTKAGGFSPAAAKVFSKAAKIIALLPDDEELDKRRSKRIKTADDVIKGGDKRSAKQLAGSAKAPKSDSSLVAELKKFGKPIEYLATGGAARGTDTVPAMLTPGEFVINKSAAASIGSANLNRMNKSGVAKFASGGPVGVQKFGDGGGVLGGGALTSLAIIGPAVTAAVSSLGDKSETASDGMAKATIALERLAGTLTVFAGLWIAVGKGKEILQGWTDSVKSSREAIRAEKQTAMNATLPAYAKQDSQTEKRQTLDRFKGAFEDQKSETQAFIKRKESSIRKKQNLLGNPIGAVDPEERETIVINARKEINQLGKAKERLYRINEKLRKTDNALTKAHKKVEEATNKATKAEKNLAKVRRKAGGGFLGSVGRGIKSGGSKLAGAAAVPLAIAAAVGQIGQAVTGFFSEVAARDAAAAEKKGDVAGVAKATEKQGTLDLIGKQFTLSGLFEQYLDPQSIQKSLDAIQDKKVEAAVGTATTGITQATTDFSTAGDEADIGQLTSTVGAKVSAALNAINGDGSTVDLPGIGKIGGGSVSKEQREQGLRELQKAGSAAAIEIGKAAKSPAELQKAINDLVNDSSPAGKKLKEEFTKVAESAAAVAAASKLQVEAELDKTKITSAFGRAQTAAENFALSAQTGASSLQIASNTINSSLSTIGDPSQGREAIASARSTTEQFLKSRGLAGTTTSKSIGRSFDTAAAANEFGGNLQKKFAAINALPANEAEKTAKTKALLQEAADETGNEDVRTAVAGKIQQLYGSGSGPDNKGPELDKVMKELTGTMTNLGATSKAVIDAQIKHEKDIRKLTEERRKSEEALIQAQSKSIDIQLEAGKIIEDAGGRRLTSGDRTSARTAQFNLRARDAGISGLRGGSASDIRLMGSKISEAFDRTQRKRLEGIANKKPLSVDDDNRDELRAASTELVKFSRQRINILKDELTVATKKLALEKSSVESLLAGDAEGFFNQQGQAAAASALRTGDSTLLRSLGGADIAGGVKSLQETLSPQELQKALTQSGALQGIGLGKREAQLLSGTTNEQEAINSQIREIAGAMAEISNVGANLENMSVTAAEVMITGTKIVFDNKLSQEIQNQNNIDTTPAPVAPINNIATSSKLEMNGNVTITVNGMNDQMKGSFEDFARKFIADQIGNYKVGPNATIIANNSITGP